MARYRMEASDSLTARCTTRIVCDVVDTEAMPKPRTMAEGILRSDAALIVESLNAREESGSQNRAA